MRNSTPFLLTCLQVFAFGSVFTLRGSLPLPKEFLRSTIPRSWGRDDLGEMFGLTVTVERVDMTEDDAIVAICKRGSKRQTVSILDLPLPSPPPAGAEWIAAYKYWRRGLE